MADRRCYKPGPAWESPQAFRACNSVEECFPDTEEVPGSNPGTPTKEKPVRKQHPSGFFRFLPCLLDIPQSASANKSDNIGLLFGSLSTKIPTVVDTRTFESENMAKAIEPCIYPVKATKRYPAGFRVRKVVQDAWGDRRQITEIIRPVDDTEDARQQALIEARLLVKQWERDKRTGKLFQRWNEPKQGRMNRSYHMPWHEMSASDIAEFERESAAEAEEQQDQHGQTLSEYVEDDYLKFYEAQVESGAISKSTLNKKRAAWLVIQEYSEVGATLTERTIAQVKPSDVDHLIAWMVADGRWSESTLKSYFGVIRSIFRAAATNAGESNPAAPKKLKTQVIRISGKPKSEKVVDEATLKKLDQGIQKAISTAGKRYLYCRVILRYIHTVLMGTGLRVSEVVYLRPEHIDSDAKTITVEGAAVDGEAGPTKRGKILGDAAKGVRVIPASDKVLKAISDWLAIREEHKYPSIDDCPMIFCGRNGSYLTDNQVRNYYNHACSKAKMNESVTPHQIRHTFNDRLRRDGVPSEVREAILGHADGKINRNYTNPKAMEGREAVEALYI